MNTLATLRNCALPWIALALAMTSNPAQAQGGDTRVLWNVTGDPEDLQYSAQDLTEFIGDHFEPSLAQAISDTLDPETGDATLTELNGGQPGVSDNNTIAINTSDYELWFCALVLIHEWTHCTSPRPPEDDGPDAGDPATDESNPCGPCNHRDMHTADLQRIAYLTCETDVIPNPGTACEIWKLTYERAARFHSECHHSTDGTCSYVDQPYSDYLDSSAYPCGC